MPTQLCDTITNILHTETHKHIYNRCGPPKTDNGAENLDLQVLQLLNRSVTVSDFKAGQAKGIMKLTSDPWKANLI